VHCSRVVATAAALLLLTPAEGSAQRISGQGQAFTAPLANPHLLRVFTGTLEGHYVDPPPATDAGAFAFVLFAYDPSGPALVGAPLFEQILDGPAVLEGLTVVVDRVLNPGGMYVFQIVGVVGTVMSATLSSSPDDIPDGMAVGCDVVDTNPCVIQGHNDEDVEGFRLIFAVSAVPEPGTLALLGAGVLAIAVRVWRRRQT
jgi:hypothetical protein